MNAPAKEGESGLSAVVQTRLTEEQRRLVEKAAEQDGAVFVSTWVRGVVLDRLEAMFGADAVGRGASDG